MTALQQGLNAEQADALCHAVWRRGVAARLGASCHALGQDAHVLMPEPPAPVHHEHLGLSLQLVHPHAGEVAVGEVDRWLIRSIQWRADAVSGRWMHAPTQQPPAKETPARAALERGDRHGSTSNKRRR